MKKMTKLGEDLLLKALEGEGVTKEYIELLVTEASKNRLEKKDDTKDTKDNSLHQKNNEDE